MATDPPPLEASEVLARLHAIKREATHVGFDTEGFEWCTCLSFATPASALVIDLLGLRGTPYSKAIWEAVRAIIEDPAITKVCWNAGHERGFLQWAHSITLRNYSDPMMKWAERWPELPKRLKYAASILTRLPCWTEGISFSEESETPKAAGALLWRYNGMDSISTIQLDQHPQLQPLTPTTTRLGTSSTTPIGLTPRQWDRYQFNLRLIEPLNYASQKGILYDTQAAETLRAQITPQMWAAQAEVDALAGLSIPQGPALLDHIREKCCAKRAVAKGLVTDLGSAAQHALKAYASNMGRVDSLLAAVEGGQPAAMGEAGALLDCGLNVKSTKAVVACLNRLGLPPVFKAGSKRPSADAVEGEAPAAPSQTKDQEALLKLFLKTGHPITTAILRTVALRGRLQELERGIGKDGRIRCSFTVVGTETARITSHSWLDDTGGNLQTVPKEPVNFRILYRADPGFLWWKLDLTGADLWTVACRCASLGDRTMLDDLLAGIRIPSLVGLLMESYSTTGKDRAQVKADCAAYRARLKTSGEGWKDTLWKKASHLTNYGGKPPRIRQGVIEDSYSETGTPVDPGAALCARVQQLYLARYWGLPRWWSDVGRKIMHTGCLEMATGQVREFLSRRPRLGQLDDETRREALAAEPQANTTHVIKVALDRLWQDKDNWPSGVIGDGDPIVQPLIPCVHDESVGAVLVEHKEFARAKLRAWYSVPLVIGKETVTMPFSGGFGANWGSCPEPI